MEVGLSRRARPLALAASRAGAAFPLAVAVLAGCALTIVEPSSPARAWPVTLTLVAVMAVAAFRAARHPDLTLGAALVALGVVATVAVVVPPRASHDIWSYLSYGRMVAVHHVSPYDHAPKDFPHDPFLHLVARGWRGTPSMYGPLFVAVAGLGARIAGSSALVARLWFQGLAAGALAGALALVWRRTRRPGLLVAVGLNPVVMIGIVHDGHNDLLLGLAVLAAVLLAGDGRSARAGVVAALGTAVKLTGGLALVGLVPWTWRRHGRDAALRLTGAFTAVLLALHLPVGIAPLAAMHANAGRTSRGSPWQLARLGLGVDPPLPAWTGLPRGALLSAMSYAGTAAVVALAVWAVSRRRARDRTPATAASVGLVAYAAAGPYALSSYAGWWLPSTALDMEDGLSAFGWWYGVALMAAYQLPPLYEISSPFALVVVSYLFPVVALAAFVFAVGRYHRGDRRGAPSPGRRAPLATGLPGSWPCPDTATPASASVTSTGRARSTSMSWDSKRSSTST